MQFKQDYRQWNQMSYVREYSKMVGETMRKRTNIRLRTRTVHLDLPVPRLECPVCNTLDRIQKVERDSKTLIRRGGDTGSCGHCGTRYEVQLKKDVIISIVDKKSVHVTKFRYMAASLAPIVRDQLANYWIAHRKGKLPEILRLEVEI